MEMLPYSIVTLAYFEDMDKRTIIRFKTADTTAIERFNGFKLY